MILLAGLESGLGVVIVTARSTRLLPERVRLKPLSTQIDPLCIAAGHRIERAHDKPFAVFIEKLHRAPVTFAKAFAPVAENSYPTRDTCQ